MPQISDCSLLDFDGCTFFFFHFLFHHLSVQCSAVSLPGSCYMCTLRSFSFCRTLEVLCDGVGRMEGLQKSRSFQTVHPRSDIVTGRQFGCLHGVWIGYCSIHGLNVGSE